MSKKILVILRHMTSMENMQVFANENNISLHCVAMDPIVSPNEVDEALAQIEILVPVCDVIAIGTKVYDNDKEVSRLGEFLEMLKGMGLGNKPVCLTHVRDFDEEEFKRLKAIHQNLKLVENDDLKRHGPARFGAMIMDALKA